MYIRTYIFIDINWFERYCITKNCSKFKQGKYRQKVDLLLLKHQMEHTSV